VTNLSGTDARSLAREGREAKTTQQSRSGPLGYRACPDVRDAARAARYFGGAGEARRTILSKNINVNPDQYKVAGRERQGEDIVQTEHKQAHKNALQRAKIGSRGTKKPMTAKPRKRG
jgi:hypothetical protein